MSIPFYRYVRYEDDGITVYECLQCGGQIHIGGPLFDATYCWCCGVKFKGFIFPKPYEYVSLAHSEKLVFIVQEASVFIKDRRD